jgi:hypothetical protein
MFYTLLPKIYSNTLFISKGLPQQNRLKGIDFGWPDSHRLPAACIFLIHFHWKQTSFLGRIHSEQPKEIR